MGNFIDKIHLRQPLRALEPLELRVEDLGPILDGLLYLGWVMVHRGWFLIACQGISTVPRRRVRTSLLTVFVLMRWAHHSVSDEAALAI